MYWWQYNTFVQIMLLYYRNVKINSNILSVGCNVFFQSLKCLFYSARAFFFFFLLMIFSLDKCLFSKFEVSFLFSLSFLFFFFSVDVQTHTFFIRLFLTHFISFCSAFFVSFWLLVTFFLCHLFRLHMLLWQQQIWFRLHVLLWQQPICTFYIYSQGTTVCVGETIGKATRSWNRDQLMIYSKAQPITKKAGNPSWFLLSEL